MCENNNKKWSIGLTFVVWKEQPWTKVQYVHISFSSFIILAVNSRPLSDWRICGAPKSKNMSNSWKPTSAASFEVSGQQT
jgi:hypothetical protein